MVKAGKLSYRFERNSSFSEATWLYSFCQSKLAHALQSLRTSDPGSWITATSSHTLSLSSSIILLPEHFRLAKTQSLLILQVSRSYLILFRVRSFWREHCNLTSRDICRPPLRYLVPAHCISRVPLSIKASSDEPATTLLLRTFWYVSSSYHGLLFHLIYYMNSASNHYSEATF